jgi:hypothetical protein
MIVLFNYLRNFHTIFQNSCRNLYLISRPGVPFMHTFGNTCYHLSFFFIITILTSVNLYPMWLWSTLVWSLVVLKTFSWFYWLDVFLGGKKCIQFLWPIFNQGFVLFFGYWVVRVLYVFLLLTPHQVYVLKIFQPIFRMLFYCFLCCEKAF